MALLALGVNHKTAPVGVREQVSFAPEEIPEALRALTELDQVNEAAILSTCNRTEVLCSVENADSEVLVDWFHHFHRLKPDEVDPYVYIHPDHLAVRHLLRVASGLDSLVLGEPQILGQLKEAYQEAAKNGSVGTLLGRLFQHTFAVAKQIRTDTAIGSSPVSVAFAAVSLARQIFTDLGERSVLLIGAGETIELAARHLTEHQIQNLVVANRTLERAEHLSEEFGGQAISLAQLPEHLAAADIVISSTASQLPILGKGTVERALKARKRRPVLMVDIAVPRDIEPEVGQLDDVYLYAVDDLKTIIEEGLRSRQEAAEQAEEIIEHQVTQFMGWVRSLDAITTIRAYRQRADEMRAMEVTKAQRQLQHGADPEEVISRLAHGLTNKLIHAPSVNMRHAGFEGRSELLEAARELLDLKDPHDA